jgi:hypothetical protein
VFKVGQVNPAIRSPSLRPRLRPPKAIIRKAVQKIAQGYFRSILRGDAGKPIRAFSRANAASNADHDKGVMCKTILLIHTKIVRGLFFSVNGAVFLSRRNGDNLD